MSEIRKLKIFLSYAHADVEHVRKLYQFLIDADIDVWFDEESLIAGQDWRATIEDALNNSDAIIICLSTVSVSKEGFVQKEYNFALDKALEIPDGKIFLIPVRLEECEVPMRLARFHWVDLYRQNGYEKLLKSIKMRSSQLGLDGYQIKKIHNLETLTKQDVSWEIENNYSKNIFPFGIDKIFKKIFSKVGEFTSSVYPLFSKFWSDTKKSSPSIKLYNSYSIISWGFSYTPLLLLFPFLSNTIWAAYYALAKEIRHITPIDIHFPALILITLIATVQWVFIRKKVLGAYRWIIFNFLFFTLLVILSEMLSLSYLARGDSAYWQKYYQTSFFSVILIWVVFNISIRLLDIFPNNSFIKFFSHENSLNLDFGVKWLSSVLIGPLFALMFILLLDYIFPFVNMWYSGVVTMLCFGFVTSIFQILLLNHFRHKLFFILANALLCSAIGLIRDDSYWILGIWPWLIGNLFFWIINYNKNQPMKAEQ